MYSGGKKLSDTSRMAQLLASVAIQATPLERAVFTIYAPGSIPLFDVPGIYIGCYMVESVLRSTLECFYSQSCIHELAFHIAPYASMTIIALDASSRTEYSVNSTIQELVDNLMIEEWNVSTIYERYYNECQPTQCSYTVERRNDVVYIVTILFGIASGLTMILRHVVPRFVKFVVYWIRRQRIRVRQETAAVQT